MRPVGLSPSPSASPRERLTSDDTLRLTKEARDGGRLSGEVEVFGGHKLLAIKLLRDESLRHLKLNGFFFSIAKKTCSRSVKSPYTGRPRS